VLTIWLSSMACGPVTGTRWASPVSIAPPGLVYLRWVHTTYLVANNLVPEEVWMDHLGGFGLAGCPFTCYISGTPWKWMLDEQVVPMGIVSNFSLVRRPFLWLSRYNVSARSHGCAHEFRLPL
jgi:hypothetical protein